MANAGTIVVGLIAKTGSFQKGMKGAGRLVDKFGGAVDAVTGAVFRYGTIAAAAAAGGIAYLVKKQMQEIDTIAKLSDRIAVSTEFLASFGHAAKIAGTDQAAFNKSIEMFVRRLGEVKQGTGEAKYGLESLGLSADELINMGAEDAFLRVAEGIRGLSSQSEKAAAAYRFFGRSGSQMLNLLESDLSGVMAEGQKLGIAFSRLDASKVEAANDSLERMGKLFVGLGRTLAIEISPHIEAVATSIQNVATQGGGMGSVVTGAFEQMTLSVVRFANEVEKIFSKTGPFRGMGLRMQGLAGIVQAQLTGDTDIYEKFIENVKEAEGKLTDTSDIEKYFQKLRSSAEEIRLIRELQNDAAWDRALGKIPKMPDISDEDKKENLFLDQKTGGVEVFSSRNIDLRGLQDQGSTVPQKLDTLIGYARETASIQRKAFA